MGLGSETKSMGVDDHSHGELEKGILGLFGPSMK